MKKKLMCTKAILVFFSLVILPLFSSVIVTAAPISINSIVQVQNAGTVGLNVRQTPGGVENGERFDGDRGIVIGGPQNAYYGGVLYKWWKISWQYGNLIGWSVEYYPGGVTYLVDVPPVTPSLTFPGSQSPPGSYIDTLTPTFQWTESYGADSYALAISESPYGPDNVFYNPQHLYGTSHTIPSGQLQPGKLYRWNMQAWHGSELSPISELLYFQTYPLYTITFQTDPSNEGTITFNGNTYTNGQTTLVAPGTYSIFPNPSTGSFIQWTTTGGITVSNPSLPSTTATITNTGTLKALFYTTSNPEITFQTDPNNGGTITFNSNTYSNGQSVQVPSGTYNINANPTSGFNFLEWTTTGGVSVPYPTNQGTYATVNSIGTLKASFNRPPNVPNIPSGPASLTTGQSGTFSTSATDPDGDQVQYLFDWDANGAHQYSTYTNLVPSGQSGSMSQVWNIAGTYVVKSQAYDEHGSPSVWSNGFMVTVSGGNQPPSTKFETGDYVKIIADNGWNIRSEHTIDNNNIITPPSPIQKNSYLKILENENNGIFVDGHYWWFVSYITYTGWCAEEGLEIDTEEDYIQYLIDYLRILENDFLVTINDDTYIIATLSKKIDPEEFIVLPDSGQTIIYLDSQGRTIKDGEVVRKIGLIEKAEELSTNINIKIEDLNEIKEIHNKWDLAKLVRTSYGMLLSQSFWDIVNELRIFYDLRGTLSIYEMLDDLSKVAGPTVLSYFIERLMERIIWDPWQSLVVDLTYNANSAIASYENAQQIMNNQEKFDDYDIAYSFLSAVYNGRKYEESAIYLNQKVFNNYAIILEAMKPLIGSIPGYGSFVKFIPIVIEGAAAVAWGADVDCEYIYQTGRSSADLTYKIYENGEYSLKISGKKSVITDYKIAYLYADYQASEERFECREGVVEGYWEGIEKIKDYFLNIKLPKIFSPVELRVYDSEHRLSGVLNGVVKEDIPFSYYIFENETLFIFNATDIYSYEIFGIDNEDYNFSISSVENSSLLFFNSTNIPTIIGATHVYSINWSALSQGEEGVNIQIDNDGDGNFEHNYTTNATLSVPSASFTYNLIDRNLTFNASNSFINPYIDATFTWDFDDGTTGNGILVNHSYSENGTYTVTLTVIDDDGKNDTMSKTISVGENQPPLNPGYEIGTGALEPLGAQANVMKIARTFDGILHCVYSRSDGLYSQIYHSYSADNGETWSEEPLTSENYDQILPALATDSHDYLHVVWQGCYAESPDHPQIRYRKYTTGWSPISSIYTDTGWDQREPSVAIDSQDHLHVVWQNINFIGGAWCSNGCGPLSYSTYIDSWSIPECVGEDEQYRECRQNLIIDSNDNLHLAFDTDDYHGESCWHFAYREKTTSWQPTESFSCLEGRPSLAVDSTGIVHLLNLYDRNILYRKRTTTGWEDPISLTPTPSDGIQRTASITLDSNDNLHVTWADNGNIVYTKYTTSWQPPETIISDTDAISPTLIGSWYPMVNGVHPNRPQTGYAFIWNDGPIIKFYKSPDLTWDDGSENIIYVPDDYPTIQEAVGNTASGCTIIVRDGTYTENVNIDKDHLTIKSENGAASTFIQAAYPDDFVVDIRANSVTLTGFTITSEPSGWTAGVYLEGAKYCTISDNIFENNYNSIWLELFANNNTVENNTCTGGSHGIHLEHCSNNSIINNTCSNNQFNWGDGIFLEGYHTYNNILIYNTVSGNIHGIHMGHPDNAAMDNRIYQNNFIDNDENFWVEIPSIINTWNSTEQVTYVFNGNTITNHLGNHWGNYEGVDTNQDGIGDTPFIIDENNYDNYPLMESFENYPAGQPPVSPGYEIGTGYLGFFYEQQHTFDHAQRKITRTSDGVLHCVYNRSNGGYSQIYHSYSLDNGETWDEEQLTSESYNQTLPSIATDSHDYLHVVWQGCYADSPDHPQIRYRKYTTQWDAVSNITSDISWDHADPVIAIDSQDNPHVVWSQVDTFPYTKGPIYYSKYTDSWSQPELIGKGDGYIEEYPSLVIDKYDYVHVAWSEGGYLGQDCWHTAYRRYTTFWELIENFECLTRDPYLAVDNQGNVHLVTIYHPIDPYFDGLLYYKRTASGWESPLAIAPVTDGTKHPSIMVDSNDSVHVLWNDNGNILYRKYISSWQDTETLISDTDSNYPVLIWSWYPVVNDVQPNRPQNGYAFAWNDGPTIRFYKSPDLTWGSGGTQPPNQGYEVGTGILGTQANVMKLARTSNGMLHCVYSRSDGLYSQIYHSYSSDNGETWTEEPLTSESYDQTLPAIATDSHDYLHVVWQGCCSESPTHPQIRYRKYTTTWSPISSITTDTGWDQREPAIAVDSQDHLHVVWQNINFIGGAWCSGGCGPLSYSMYTDSWSTPECIGENEQYREIRQSLVVDGNDNLHLAFDTDDYHGESCWHFAYREKTTSWQPVESFPCIENRPSLAIDSNENVHLVSQIYLYTTLDELYRKKTVSGWENPTYLTSGNLIPQDQKPDIALDSNDYVHVVWNDNGNIVHREFTTSWQSSETIISDTDSISPDLIWSWYPVINGVHPNKPQNGYAFVWNDGSTIRFYKSPDLSWESNGGNQPKGNILVYSTTSDGTPYDKTYFDTDLPMILENYGYSTTVTDRKSTPQITSSLLEQYDELWVFSSYLASVTQFSQSEIDTLLNFRNQGHGLLIMADHTDDLYDYSDDANQISVPLGVTYYGYSYPGENGESIEPDFVQHPLFTGVDSIACHESEAQMIVNNPAQVLATNNGDNVIAIVDDGLGRVVFDVSFPRMFNAGFAGFNWILIGDTPQYVRNIADWLIGGGYQPPSGGIVGYWSFDEGTGDIVHDTSGNGNDGTIYGDATWTTGVSGGALSFDGIDDYVEIPDVSDFIFKDESVTFSAWVQIMDNPDLYRTFIFLGDSDDYSREPYFFMGKSRGDYLDGRLFANVVSEDQTSYIAVSDQNGLTLPKNTWIHIVGVVDYANLLLRLYINGNLEDSVPLGSYDLGTATQLKLRFGMSTFTTDDLQHNGLLDEIRIYDKALSEAEIQDLYNQGGGSQPPGTIIYVPDDYSTIQAAVDAALSGDTIIVRDGTYIENVNVNTDHLTIQSENGPTSTIVQAADSNDNTFEIQANFITINGFTIQGASASITEAGIYLYYGEGCRFTRNICRENHIGIALWTSSNNWLDNNSCSWNTHFGIALGYSSSYNILENNTCNWNQLYGTGDGILLGSWSEYNTIRNNICSHNDGTGIAFSQSSYNTVVKNTCSENLVGICRYADSISNTIYLNNFISNTENVYSDTSASTWNSLSPITYTYSGNTYSNNMGNYWSDYLGSDENSDGIGEQPYGVGGGNYDNYPLMDSFENYFGGGSQPPSGDLVGYWSFDSQSSPGNDDSDYNNNGIVYGATWLSNGMVNGALDFDGTDDWVEIQDDNSLDLTGDFTMICWIYQHTNTGIGDTQGMFLSKHQPYYDDDHSWWWSSRYDKSAFGNYPGSEINGNHVISLNTWTQVAVTFNDATDEYRFYTNGQVDTQFTANIVIENNNKKIAIGSEYGEKNFFDGLLDEVHVYTRVLSQSEIQELYNPGGGGQIPDANAGDISGQPTTMHQDTIYSITAKYQDPNGRDNLKYCYLRLNHPSKPLTMMWVQSDSSYSPWSGEEGENYLILESVNSIQINNGYELTWNFKINNNWPEVESAIDFGVFAFDDDDLESGWDFDNTDASFNIDEVAPQMIQDFVAEDYEDGKCTLHWTNPPDEDLSLVRIVKNAYYFPKNHLDGSKVAEINAVPGASITFIDNNAENKNLYYYAVFPSDNLGNWNEKVFKGKNADMGRPGLVTCDFTVATTLKEGDSYCFDNYGIQNISPSTQISIADEIFDWTGVEEPIKNEIIKTWFIAQLNGNCFGFVSSTLMEKVYPYYDYFLEDYPETSLSHLPDPPFIWYPNMGWDGSDPINSILRHISKFMNQQYSEILQKYQNDVYDHPENHEPKTVIQRLQQLMNKDMCLLILGDDKKFFHAVLPYRVEAEGTGYKVFVYDPNFEGYDDDLPYQIYYLIEENKWERYAYGLVPEPERIGNMLSLIPIRDIYHNGLKHKPDIPLSAPIKDCYITGKNMSIYLRDELGRITGIMNYTIHNQIPNATIRNYITDDATIENLNSQGLRFRGNNSFTINIQGYGNGSYSLWQFGFGYFVNVSSIQLHNRSIDSYVLSSGSMSITCSENQLAKRYNLTIFNASVNTYFKALNIPLNPGEIHNYTIDWPALTEEQEGVTIQIDKDGDGVFEKTFFSDSELVHDEYILNIDDISPITNKIINSPKYGAEDEWVTSSTEFNLTAIDDLSGVDATYYRIWYNGAWTPWNEYAGNFTLAGEGTHYLEYYSVDNAGNVEETHNQTHYVIDTSLGTTIVFMDSTSDPMSGGVVQYYSSGWKDFGVTDDGGQVCKMIPDGTYTFRMKYEGAGIDQTQDISMDSVVVFSTVDVTVQLLDSNGNGLSDGDVKFYASGWKTFGTSDASGEVHKELLPKSYTFRMICEGASVDQTQDISMDSVVVFSTVDVTVELLDSNGNGLSDGDVKFYASGWKTFGTTDASGEVHKELLPKSYTFRITYEGEICDKTQDIGMDPLVIFNVVMFNTMDVIVELLDSSGTGLNGGEVLYYASGWKPFGTTDGGGEAHREMLPGSYTFRMKYEGESIDKVQNIGLDPLVVFSAVDVTVKLLDSSGTGLNGGEVLYYASGWKPFGTTDGGGEVHHEMLPGSYTFRMKYEGESIDKVQNIGLDPLVVFSAVDVTVKLLDSSGTGLNGGEVLYYASGWKPFGTTDGGGEAHHEMLPGSYTFRMKYQGANVDKTQVISSGSTVIFSTGNVVSDSNHCTKFYASGWRTFTQYIELLPVSYKFRFNDGTSDINFIVIAGVTNHIH